MALAALIGAALLGSVAPAHGQDDWGAHVQHLLEAHSMQQFGVVQPLHSSSAGPCTAANNALSVDVAKGLNVSVVSNATHALNDMIAFWPNDENPTHLFIAVESGRNADGTNPSLQVVELNGNPDSNARTVLTGLNSTDPVRRTPWGTIIVGEERNDDGQLRLGALRVGNYPLEVSAPGFARLFPLSAPCGGRRSGSSSERAAQIHPRIAWESS